MEIPGSYGKRYSVLSFFREIEERAGKPDCGAVPGTTILTTAVPLTATTISGGATTSTTISAFGWRAVVAALFAVRVGAWECTESAIEQSSPVPAMLATAFRKTIESGSLVGFMPNSPSIHILS
jgi:hypothetical protein